MSHERQFRRILMRSLAVTTLTAGSLGIAGTLAAAPTAARAPVGTGSCPAVYPVSALHAGMTAYGLTTSRGTTPSRFSVRVLGVLHDGIAPGIDMILIRADSTAIRAAGGIWAGMSGSPVYARDGRLIGAVSYGLAFGPSRTGGVTPARAMYDVRSFPRDTGSGYATHPMLTPALRARVVATGAGTAAAAAGGLTQLPTPVAVSGVPQRQLDRLAQLVGSPASVRMFTAGSASTKQVSPAVVRPGAPMAAAVSYGAFTYAGIGTTTAVCGKRVLAFGHPMMAFGSTSESAHAASVLYIEKETLGPPFVVGNVGGVVGTITQDRLSAIGGRLGKAAPATRIRVGAMAATGLYRGGRSLAPVTTWLPIAAANAAYGVTWSALQEDAVGSAVIHWSMSGHRADGTRWHYTRADRTNSQYGIGYSVGDMIYYPLSTIVENPFEKVTVDWLNIRVRVTQVYREYTLTGLKVLQGTRYVPVTPDLVVEAKPGQALSLRATLASYQNPKGHEHIDLTLRVPRSVQPGATGQVTVTGGADSGVSPEGAAPSSNAPTSFSDLLKQLKATPQNDRLYAQLGFADANGNITAVSHDRINMLRVVRGSLTLQVMVPGGEEEPPPVG